MKEIAIEDIKTISFDILCDVHDFCVEHGICYSLSYGTLLGAIRHKGFIPWDDDIDIMMPRPDYERFCETYNSEKGFRCLCAQKDRYWSAYARVCDMERTIVESPAPMGEKPNGVWIDLFPVDGAEDDELLWYRHAKDAKEKLNELLLHRFRVKLLRGNLISKCKYLVYYLMGKCRVEEITMQYVSLCKRIPYGKTFYVCDYTGCHHDLPKRHSISLFDEFVMKEFEGKQFCVIGGYDQFLRNCYGDYMELPPVEKRVYLHSAHKYFWKK